MVTAHAFHSKCDVYNGTISIVKTTQNRVFGGYNSDNWSGSGHKSVPDTFLFSLSNNNEFIKFICIRQYYAVFCNPSHLSTFGHDGCVSLLFCFSFFINFFNFLGFAY